MSAKRQYSVYARHIRESIEHALTFAAGMSYEQFIDDKRTNYATVRALGIIDEATKRLPPEVRVLDPDIPWSDLSRMRDRIIDRHDEVNLAIVWDTVQRDLPPILSQVARLQHELEQREDEERERE